MRSKKRPTIRHRIEYLLFRGFEFLINRISLETAFKAGEFIGRLSFRFHKGLREKLMFNLRRAYGSEKSDSELLELSADVFERNGANFLTSLRVPFLDNDELEKHLIFEGLDQFLQHVEQRGVVLVLPHMGNWELLAQGMFLIEGDINIGTHYRPLNNSLIDQIVGRRRKRRGLRLFAKHDSTHRLTSFVRDGGALAILADQRVGRRGSAGTFFGRPTTLSPLPHLVAKRAKAQLIALHCETIGHCQWKVQFRPIEEKTAQACASSLEEAWRQSPSDVFWFEDRWRLKSNKSFEFLTKYLEDHKVTRPLRLVCLDTDPPALEIVDGLLTIERSPFNFHRSDKEIREDLAEFSRSGRVPVDAFCCPARFVPMLKNLSDKILVISGGDHLDSRNS